MNPKYPNIYHSFVFGLNNDDHLQYLHLSNPRLITANHTFSGLIPFSIAGDGYGILISGLNSNYLNGLTSNDFALLNHTHTTGQIVNFTTGVYDAVNPWLTGKFISGNGINFNVLNNSLQFSISGLNNLLPTGYSASLIGNGTVNDTEFSYLDGVTSSIQNQLNNKLSQNQLITVTGDIIGTGITNINVSLINTGVSSGVYSYPTLSIDNKGRILSATNNIPTTGTVTNINFVNTSGIVVNVTNPTSTPVVEIGLQRIVPISIVASQHISGINLTGNNTGDQLINLSGDISGTGNTSITTTLANVNSNIGSFTNANITVNSKGLITAASNGASSIVYAPTGASYITIGNDSSLGAERAITGGSGINFIDGGANSTFTIQVQPTGINHNLLLNLTAGDPHTQYHNDARGLTWLGTRSTSDLPEGTNLYYQASRVRNEITGTLRAGNGIQLSGVNTNWYINISGLADYLIPTGINTTKIGLGTVDNTKFDFLSTLTSNVQTQLNSKSSGTLTNFVFNNQSGIFGDVFNSSSIPVLRLGLGNITPQSINSLGFISGINLSGNNTGDQLINLTGDITGTGTTSIGTTLAIVNSTTGVYSYPTLTVNNKGLITSITSNTLPAYAPTGASYVLISSDSNLTNERILTAGSGINFVDNGANNNFVIHVQSTGINHSLLLNLSSDSHTQYLHKTPSTTGRNFIKPDFDIETALIIQGCHQDSPVFGSGTFISFDKANGDPVFRITTLDETPDKIRIYSPFEIFSNNEIRFFNSAGSNYVSLSSPTSIPLSYNLKLPTTTGLVGQVLQFGAGGQLSWVSVAAGTFAPTGSTYLTLSTDSSLANERVLTAGTGINFTDSGANGILRINVQPTGINHNSLQNLTVGDPHTQYISTSPGSDSRNIITPGLSVHVNGLVVQQSDPSTFPGYGTDQPYFGVWKHGGTNPAWMLLNNDGIFQQVRQTVPLRMYNSAYTNFVSVQVGSLSSDVTFQLPTSNGSNGQVLSTDGFGITSWTTVSSSGGGSYTDEQAQDAIGSILNNSNNLQLYYNDASNAISGLVIESNLNINNTTGILSISRGGTNASTAGQALNNLLPTQTSGRFLFTDGINPYFRKNEYNFGINIEGYPIATGSKGFSRIASASIINKCDIFSSATGTIQVDLQKSNSVSYPTFSSILNNSLITLSNQNYNNQSISNWTTGLAAGDLLRFNVVNVSGINNLNIHLTLENN